MRAVLAGIALVVALVVAGCGGSSSTTTTNSSGNGEASKSAQQVLADATKAADAASAVHISGQVNAQGQRIGLDLTVVNGSGATGSLTLKGQTVDLVILGGEAYMKAGAAFWTRVGGSAGADIAQLVADKWLKFPTSNPQFGGFAKFANAKALFNSIKSGHGTLTNKGATIYKGQSVVDLFDGSKNGTLYVAATGTAYPVAIVKTGGTSGGSITFDSWNKSVTLTAPSGAIDISQLGGQLGG